MIRGIDISSYQAGLDISSLKKNGIDFLILKIGEGRTLVDNCFDAFYNAAIEENIPVGAYFYSYATTTSYAIRDANRALNLINGRKLPLGVFIDVEDPSQLALSDSSLTSVVKAWCDTIRDAGYRPGAYGSDLCLWAKVGPAYLGDDVLIWSASWGGKPHIQCDVWQDSDKGHIPGFKGKIDTDACVSERFEKLILNKTDDHSLNPEPISEYPPSCIVTGDLPILKIGDYDQESGVRGGLAGGYVKLMQNRLIYRHFSCGGAGADGIFGSATEQSVKNFQEETNLPITGVMEEKTWARLLFI